MKKLKPKGLAPVLRESVQEIIRFKQNREVIDLDHMAKLIRVDIDALIHIQGVVIVNSLDGNSHRLFQVGLDLIRQTQITG